MAIVSVHVWDATGNKRQQVDMPDDAPVNRILAVLLEKMNFPQYAPDGQILSYKFHHRSSGKQLLDDQCLRDVGVKDGDVLRLQPEITAGAERQRAEDGMQKAECRRQNGGKERESL
jgi:uncharacterized ubiquitin-like protein YukD